MDESDARSSPGVRKLRLLLDPGLPGGAGAGLDAVRDDDRGRLRPAADREPRAVRGRAQLLPVRRQGRPIGLLAPPNHNVIDNFGRLGVQPASDRLDRGQALLDRLRRRHPGHRARGRRRRRPAAATRAPRRSPQQFVKNALAQEGNRTIFEKLARGGAGVPAHPPVEQGEDPPRVPELDLLRQRRLRDRVGRARVLRQRWATTRTRGRLDNCGHAATHPRRAPRSYARIRRRCWRAWSPTRPRSTRSITRTPRPARRNLVLQDMLAQGYITPAQYEQGIAQALPTPDDDRAAAGAAGGAVLHELGAAADPRRRLGQPLPRLLRRPEDPDDDRPRAAAAAEQAVHRAPDRTGRPTASLVSIDNATGQVRAMVGGPLVDGHEDYEQYPFNLATAGRAPARLVVQAVHARGRAAARLTPDSVCRLKAADLVVPNSGGKEIYHVHNDDNVYRAPITVADATADSDNSGVHAARPQRRHQADQPHGHGGWASPRRSRPTPAMIIGGLKVGVSPLDMAHAYETLATGGSRVYDPAAGLTAQGPDRDRADPVSARQMSRQEQAGRPRRITSGAPA